MGTFLATSLLVVPIIAWMTGPLILDASHVGMPRILSAPLETFPNSRKSNFPGTATRLDSYSSAARSIESAAAKRPTR